MITKIILLQYNRKTIENLKQEKDALQSELEAMEKNWKSQNKISKVKDKEIHDLHKENGLVTESLKQASREFKDLTIKMNNEMKDLEKKQRKE